jgi:hypothetical protein
VSEDREKRHLPRYDGRVDPDSLTPKDEERAAGPEGPSADVVLRALSVVPFLLAAAVGLIAIISWVLIIVFGVGSAEPIWESIQGLSGTELVWQLFLAVVVGVVAVLITLAASWATAHGFREDAGRPFWTMTQAVWGLVAVGLVYLARTKGGWLEDAGLSRVDWWFGLLVVAFAMILAGVRLRRAPRAPEEGDE